jgi:hypothetical protein
LRERTRIRITDLIHFLFILDSKVLILSKYFVEEAWCCGSRGAASLLAGAAELQISLREPRSCKSPCRSRGAANLLAGAAELQISLRELRSFKSPCRCRGAASLLAGAGAASVCISFSNVALYV